MKKLQLMILGMSLAYSLSAQTAPKNALLVGAQAQAWVEMAHAAQLKHHITAQDVLYPTAQQHFPKAMLDTLMQYDWIHVANYWYVSKTFSTEINEIGYQTKFDRFLADGSRQSCYAFQQTPYRLAYMVQSENVPEPTVTLGEKLGYTWLFTSDKEYDDHRIVSYRDDVLILDTCDGNQKFGDVNYTRRMRNVYIKVPRWDIGSDDIVRYQE